MKLLPFHRDDGDADVRKDEIFQTKVEEFEKLLRPLLRLAREVVVSVMRLTNAAEQYRHNPSQFTSFRRQEGTAGMIK